MSFSDSLQAQCLMRGRGQEYWAQADGLPLSLKCVSNGRARYVIDRREFAVDDGGWLIVNEDQPYSIEIDSPTVVDTFIVWFPRGWAEEAWSSATTPSRSLLDENSLACDHKPSVDFFARYTLNENSVAPALHALREKALSGEILEDGWLEEKLRGLLARMLATNDEVARLMDRVPGARATTRNELWLRLNRARDFIHARCDTPLSLTASAEVAALSPTHFLRAFAATFGQTPHAWLTACRIERAKLLLARTELPVTEICLAVGYEGLGSFSTWFHRITGYSPNKWRRAQGVRRAIRNFREVFP